MDPVFSSGSDLFFWTCHLIVSQLQRVNQRGGRSWEQEVEEEPLSSTSELRSSREIAIKIQKVPHSFLSPISIESGESLSLRRNQRQISHSTISLCSITRKKKREERLIWME